MRFEGWQRKGSKVQSSNRKQGISCDQGKQTTVSVHRLNSVIVLR